MASKVYHRKKWTCVGYRQFPAMPRAAHRKIRAAFDGRFSRLLETSAQLADQGGFKITWPREFEI